MAGLSFMPSPTKVTVRPSSCMRRSMDTLSWGRHSGYISVIPARAATASAAARLSPVSMAILLTPSLLSLAMLAAASGLRASETAIRRHSLPSTAASTVVALCRCRARISSSWPGVSSTPRLSISFSLPTSTLLPPITPSMPMPLWVSTSVTVAAAMPRDAAYRTIALASGWSEACSAAAASASAPYSSSQ